MDRLARNSGAGAFSQMSFEDRTALIASLEAGKADPQLLPGGGKPAFQMVLDHALQGFYGNPRHGGNKDYASWRMVGVPAMPVRGRQHYEVAATYPEKS